MELHIQCEATYLLDLKLFIHCVMYLTISKVRNAEGWKSIQTPEASDALLSWKLPLNLT